MAQTMTDFTELRRRYVDLAQPRLGSAVVYATDDFFADSFTYAAEAEARMK